MDEYYEKANVLFLSLGIMQAIFIIGFAISPFLWIWHSWEIAWKTGLTGIAGVLIVGIIYKILKAIVIKLINEGKI